MYLTFFSLSKKPFELLPNPDFLFLSEAHKKALTFLKYGLMEHTGFILFTGEVGTGKTTIIRRLLNKIPTDMTLAKLFNTQVNSIQLLRMINDDFGIASTSKDKADLLRELNEFLIDQYAAGRRSILIIDEAQNLGPEQLEEIRLLSNLETSHAKLLQIILVGQPELREKLGGASLIQLRQRILVHCHLAPLTQQEVEAYIYHRLEQSGNRDALHWESGAMTIVHAATRGIPRLINILCHYILLDAFSHNTRVVTCMSVKEILNHLDFETQFWPEDKIVEQKEKPSTPAKAVAVNELAALESSLRQMASVMERMRDSLTLLQVSLVSLSQAMIFATQTDTNTKKKPYHLNTGKPTRCMVRRLSKGRAADEGNGAPAAKVSAPQKIGPQTASMPQQSKTRPSDEGQAGYARTSAPQGDVTQTPPHQQSPARDEKTKTAPLQDRRPLSQATRFTS